MVGCRIIEAEGPESTRTDTQAKGAVSRRQERPEGALWPQRKSPSLWLAAFSQPVPVFPALRS